MITGLILLLIAGGWYGVLRAIDDDKWSQFNKRHCLVAWVFLVAPFVLHFWGLMETIEWAQIHPFDPEFVSGDYDPKEDGFDLLIWLIISVAGPLIISATVQKALISWANPRRDSRRT